MVQIRRGYNFESEKKILIVKSDFGIINQEFEGQISKRNELLRCDKTNFKTSCLKQRTANFLKGCLFNGLVPVITCTKFQFNQIISALFSEV